MLSLIIVDASIWMFECQVTFSTAMFVLAPPATLIFILFLSNSMHLIFMPFSDTLIFLTYHYPDTLSLTLCIKVASVLAWPAFIDKSFFFNIFEPVFDGLKFRLKQPHILFDISYTQNSIWKDLKAVVNLHHSLAFSLHNYLKMLMCRS